MVAPLNFWISLVAQTVMSLSAMQETRVPSLGQEDPLEKTKAAPPVLLLGEFHGQRSLMGYSPWGCKESDTSERLTHTSGSALLVAWLSSRGMGKGLEIEKWEMGWEFRLWCCELGWERSFTSADENPRWWREYIVECQRQALHSKAALLTHLDHWWPCGYIYFTHFSQWTVC